MKRAWHRFTDNAGANPLQVLVIVGSLALVGYAIVLFGPTHLWSSKVWWHSVAVWFLGAVVLHDLILFPLYLVSDHSASAAWRSLHRRRSTPPLVNPTNYLRLPVMASGLLLLLFFPGIIQQGSTTYLGATGMTQAPFLDRWLLLTAAMFLLSAAIFAVRTGLAHRSRRLAQSAAHAPASEHAP